MQIQSNQPIVTKNMDTTDEAISIETPMKALKKLYILFIPLGGITFAFGGPIAIAFGLVIGWAAAYITLQAISGIKLIKLNLRNYTLSHPVTDEQLYEQLLTTELHPDFKLEKGTWGVRFVFKNTTRHTIFIDHKKQSYSIVSKLTKKNLIKKRHNPGVTEYSYAFTAVPIIKQIIETAVVKHALSNESKENTTIS
ncbi:hypothetical protein [Paenibacillus crassostreae]|uniref:Uncharacterized protein n=1 Tax=Paenibacillus crassostreae TaxID=1763538 RepID=A0A162N751_9BACL|nr:hypothetical protein [Paenibacillus crassostreae]AOZ92285.1 hypothetical protein LPB68_08635 [Paenibacillus crassostreae]OAB71002.1 hypothetical protein PNBC_20785 [Paenibacillus crassostreae]